jgi:hypothetical protein
MLVADLFIRRAHQPGAGFVAKVISGNLVNLRHVMRSMRRQQAEYRVLGQVRVGAAQKRGNFVGVGGDGLDRLLPAGLRMSHHRGVVVANRSPVCGQQFEQAIGSRLTVERRDRRGERLRVGDDLGFGDFALRFVASLRGEHIPADPEDVLDPQVTQRHLRLEHGDRFRRGRGSCGDCWIGKAEARQHQQRSGERSGQCVSRHLFALLFVDCEKHFRSGPKEA